MASEASGHSHTTWIEVNIAALKHNLAELRRFVGPDVKILAVVKANAYGHGAAVASRAFVEAGADCLGVTTVEEAVELREEGINAPILVFSPLLPEQMECAIHRGLDQTLCNVELARRLQDTAKRLGKPARVHVKVDTGMGRLGVSPHELVEFVSRLRQASPVVDVVGVYTHFANAGAKDLSHARRQNALFTECLRRLEEAGITGLIRHASNSPAILAIPEARYDMIRPGTILYGQYPTSHVPRVLGLRDTWQLKTRIVELRDLPRGTRVGYGSEFTTTRRTRVAVLPVGYSDGFAVVPQSLARRASSTLRVLAEKLHGDSGGLHVVVRGRKVPVIGRVSMQMCSVDVTDIPDVSIGDEVIVPARRTAASSRIPRVYFED